MLRSAPLVLGCLLAFAAVAFAESGVHVASECFDTYHDGSFWRNCTHVEDDGTKVFEETNLSWEQWNTQVQLCV